MSERKGTKALELWCKRLVKDCPNVRIDNMTTSWRDGMAFCALVHHFRPDLIDFPSLKPENIYENNQLAFSIAEKHLGIPALLDPEDMVANDVPDRLSVLTYLSQFYQRLGHMVNTKATDNEVKSTSSSPTTTLSAPMKFGKTALDKCAACGLPVYLAQRLMVTHKLYHRRCFRCSKCSGHLNPNNFHTDNGSEYLCDSCKNEAAMPQLLNNNNDQIGMLAFTDAKHDKNNEFKSEECTRFKSRPQSILERINMFENKDSIDNKMYDSPCKESIAKESNKLNSDKISNCSVENVGSSLSDMNLENMKQLKTVKQSMVADVVNDTPNKSYKSNRNQLTFLQTQLASDISDEIRNNSIEGDRGLLHDNTHDNLQTMELKNEKVEDNLKEKPEIESRNDSPGKPFGDEENNVTDDVRLAKSLGNIISAPLEASQEPALSTSNTNEPKIAVPPRRKKHHDKKPVLPTVVVDLPKSPKDNDYPENLNPFSDDEEEDVPIDCKKESTNPFGSSEEEGDDVPPIQPPSKPPISSNQGTPAKRHIVAPNPFWSDGEEPSSDEETHKGSSMHRSSLTTSTPNLPSGRRKKARAPPPPVHTICPAMDQPSTSMDDVASISSYSSFNSTAHSDYKTSSKLTPRLAARPGGTPADSLSTTSGHGSMERGLELSSQRSLTDSAKKKGPAPGLPLPERREVKLQMTPEELQVQLDLLETQQLGLERQGVMIEQMIRDKCEGDEPCQVPQEEVEDLVIQLCELVNEKNDLFRKQTELMYIRRQQRLEQEQADIEHEIRILQSRPAVNRIDADKAREEQLVCRLVETVRLRDELVQQMERERRRERREDRAIAASIATARAKRNSDCKSSSLQSMEVLNTPKKVNKVKDKVKKQLKKAKVTLGYKKKDEEKEKKTEKHK